jgi:hypothetical protein
LFALRRFSPKTAEKSENKKNAREDQRAVHSRIQLRIIKIQFRQPAYSQNEYQPGHNGTDDLADMGHDLVRNYLPFEYLNIHSLVNSGSFNRHRSRKIRMVKIHRRYWMSFGLSGLSMISYLSPVMSIHTFPLP